MPVSKKPRKKRAAARPAAPGAPLVLPDLRAMESFMAQLSGKRAESALDAAQQIMYDAWEASSRRQRIALARKALAQS
ncbi:MAG: hypothetical protein ACT4P2_14305, partial [Pseudomonadota bacterium]